MSARTASRTSVRTQITKTKAVDDGSKLTKGKQGGKRNKNLKARGNNMIEEGYGVLGRKRKRIYAENGVGRTTVDDVVDIAGRKALSKVGRNKVTDTFIKTRRNTRVGSLDHEQRRRSSENESPNRKESTSLKAKTKKVDDKNNVQTYSNVNGMLKKGSKSNFRKVLNEETSKRTLEAREKSLKKKAQDKKSLADKSNLIEERPKRKKRIIRIDPNDITNKRLDDGAAATEKAKNKENSLEKNENADMSKNAQFRAIQPSPSILSFVEDNLLGRRREIELKRAGYNTDLSAPLDNIPFSTSSERERIEQTIFRNKLMFFAAANISSSVPPPDLPEVAFAGRSNVGKSSLLNSLTRQWGVVRTSDKPGLTQTINFFKLGSKACLVDLPGYGFAYAKDEVKEAWEELVKEYVSTRVSLKKVCLLIDTKWGLKPRDYELINLMERSQTKYQIVLTKTDLVSPIDVARRAMQIEESLKANKSAVQPAMMVSSKSGAGIRSLRTVLTKIARFAKR